MLKDGLFKNYNVKFLVDVSRIDWRKKTQECELTKLINKNKEVAGLLNLVMGDYWELGRSRYTPRFIFGALCFTKALLINQLGLFAFIKIKKEGVLRKTILSNIPFSREIKKRIEKLPLDTNASDIFDCFKTYGFYFYDNTTIKYNLSKIYIAYEKVYKILYTIEKAGPDNCSVEIIQNAIKEIDEVLNAMIDDRSCFNIVNITCYDLSNDVFNREQVIKGVVEGDAMDNTQTLTLNRPKQQENKLLTVGNKKAYQVGKGDYQHRNGVIKEEKAEMNRVYTYPIADNSDLSDLEDLLNNVIDNPDTVDKLVNYLAKNAPAAHFISEMVGCGEIDNEESLIGALNKATSLSQGMIAAGKNVRVQGGEYKVFNYLNIDYPKPIFGREFSLKQLSFCFDVAAREIEDILNKAKEEEQEEKEEVIADVQEHTEEDAAACDEYPTDLAELEKLLEERRKEVADLTVEVKQVEEDKRRRELINELIALDKQKAELNARKAELNKK